MNDDDDTDSGGDFFFDLMKVLVALFCFIVFLVIMGATVVVIADVFEGARAWFQ
jgi:hypothetical protein